MAIYQRGKSYYYDFVYKGQRYTGCIGPVSRTVAKEEEHRKKTEVIEGRLNPAKARKNPRFDAFAQDFLEWSKANKKPITCARIERTIRLFFVPFFGHKRLSDITPWHIEQYKKARKEAGKAPGTINTELALLKAILHKAVEWNTLAEHPGKSVKRLKDPRHTTRFLTEEEEEGILAVCSPALRRVVQAGLLTGFRRQELAFLRPEDIDLGRGTVSVAAAYSKNGESRTLPLGPRLKALLQEALVVRGDAPTAFVTETGESWTPDVLSSVFREASQKAAVGSLGPHVLRHTFASRLVMAGVDLRTVQELMGHKTILMTMRYAHPSPDHKRLVMEALESRFSGKSPINFHNTPSATTSAIGTKIVAIH